MRPKATLLLVATLSLVGFAQKGQLSDKPDHRSFPDLTIDARDWRVIPVQVGRRDAARYTPTPSAATFSQLRARRSR